MFNRARWVLLFVAATFIPALAWARTWTSRDGKTIEADFVDVDEEKVTLRRDGKEIKVRLELLNDADQQFLRGIRAKRAVRKQTLTGGDSDSPFESLSSAPAIASSSAPTSDDSDDSDSESKSSSSSGKKVRATNRTWTDRLGNKTGGKFVRIQGNNVVLLRGGRQITIDYWQLSADDHEYLRELLESQGQSSLIPTTNPTAVAGSPQNYGAAAAPGSYPAAPTTSSSTTTTYPGGYSSTPASTATSPSPSPSYPGGSYPSPSTSSADAGAAGGYSSSTTPGYSSSTTPGYASTTPSYPSASPSYPSASGSGASGYPSATNPSPNYPGGSYPSPDSSNPAAPSYPSTPSMSTPSYTPSMSSFEAKQCMKCGKVLPATVTAGDRCPGCGVYFSFDQTSGKTAYGGGDWSIRPGRGAIKLVVGLVILVVGGIATLVGGIAKLASGGKRKHDNEWS